MPTALPPAVKAQACIQLITSRTWSWGRTSALGPGDFSVRIRVRTSSSPASTCSVKLMVCKQASAALGQFQAIGDGALTGLSCSRQVCDSCTACCWASPTRQRCATGKRAINHHVGDTHSLRTAEPWVWPARVRFCVSAHLMCFPKTLAATVRPRRPSHNSSKYKAGTSPWMRHKS